MLLGRNCCGCGCLFIPRKRKVKGDNPASNGFCRARGRCVVLICRHPAKDHCSGLINCHYVSFGVGKQWTGVS